MSLFEKRRDLFFVKLTNDCLLQAQAHILEGVIERAKKNSGRSDELVRAGNLIAEAVRILTHWALDQLMEEATKEC